MQRAKRRRSRVRKTGQRQEDRRGAGIRKKRQKKTISRGKQRPKSKVRSQNTEWSIGDKNRTTGLIIYPRPCSLAVTYLTGGGSIGKGKEKKKPNRQRTSRRTPRTLHTMVPEKMRRHVVRKDALKRRTIGE